MIKYGKYVLINAEHLKLTEHWLERWGGWAAFLSRLLPGVHTFVSLPLGVTRYPFIPFALLTFTGSFIWCVGLAWLGAVLGAKFQEVRASTSWLDYVILGVILLAIGWFVYTVLRKRRKAAVSQTDSH